MSRHVRSRWPSACGCHDDVTGAFVKPELIKRARPEEMKGFRDVEVYEYVSPTSRS